MRGETWSTSPSRSGASTWRMIWPLLRDLGGAVELVKVKGHTTADDVAAGNIAMKDHVGNTLADRAARAGSKAAEHSSPTLALRRELTRAIRWYQWVAAYAADWRQDTTPFDHEAADRAVERGRAGRARRGDILRHVRWQLSDRQVCRRCGRHATTAQALQSLRNSRCPGSVAGRVLQRSGADLDALARNFSIGYSAMREMGAHPVDDDEGDDARLPGAADHDDGVGDAASISSADAFQMDFDDGDHSRPGRGDGDALPSPCRLVLDDPPSEEDVFGHGGALDQGPAIAVVEQSAVQSQHQQHQQQQQQQRHQQRQRKHFLEDTGPEKRARVSGLASEQGLMPGSSGALAASTSSGALAVAAAVTTKRPPQLDDGDPGAKRVRAMPAAAAASSSEHATPPVGRFRIRGKTKPTSPQIAPEAVAAEAEEAAAGEVRPEGSLRRREDWGHGHQLMFSDRGRIVWCRLCGRYAARRVGVGLAQPCNGLAAGAHATHLHRLRQGRHPLTGVSFAE